ncbi:MAG: FRG domain-containing protein [Bryobacteraceae bacterium]
MEQEVDSVATFVRAVCGIRDEWRDEHARDAKWAKENPFWKPWFRGHGDASWLLKPKLYRTPGRAVGDLVTYEEELRGEFKRRGLQLFDQLAPTGDQEKWGWYFLMQHYRSPTRLLDWTDSALMALHFALKARCEDPSFDQNLDAAVWMLDANSLNQRSFYPSDESEGVALPDWEVAEEYLTELFTEQTLQRVHPIAIDPPHLARRVGAQRSRFTIFGNDLDGLEKLASEVLILRKIVIKASAVRAIGDDLETCGISETTAFPDLEGLSRELSRGWDALGAQ